MSQLLRLVPMLLSVLAIGCGGDSGGAKPVSSGKVGSSVAAAGSGGGRFCGTLDCAPGALALDTGERCCVDAAKSLCGTKNSTGVCQAPKDDARCPTFMSPIGAFPGCCTEDNTCGLDTMGIVGWGCVPLSSPMWRKIEPNLPEPKACDAP